MNLQTHPVHAEEEGIVAVGLLPFPLTLQAGT